MLLLGSIDQWELTFSVEDSAWDSNPKAGLNRYRLFQAYTVNFAGRSLRQVGHEFYEFRDHVLGNSRSAKLLQANHFTLAAGDSVRIVGESLPFGGGSQFFARIIQKGNQSVALRSARGFPLRPSGKQAGAQ